MTIAGVLVVDKPAGPTSFDVVQRVRRILRAPRAGHAGTLDPAATGVLAICVGDAVKLQQYLSDADKAYEATVAFGAATDTEDAEGRVVERGDPSRLTAEELRAVLPRFRGDISQVPPMYSAVRVGGRRLHEAARAGESVERAPRQVRVDALELLELLPLEPPQDRVEAAPVRLARFTVRCGKGTYVRTLAADLGRALGVPAHLAALRRTEASGFRAEEAVTLEEAERLGREALLARLVPLGDALRTFPVLEVSWAEARDLAHGRALRRELAPGKAAARAPDGRLVAVCAAGDRGLCPERVLLGPGDLGRAGAEER
ncbi:tRNA pseudouridine(55) synthase TruB [Anaeromyxobacter sp. Fw109-5]|uniref:tRNA pseudouridine(55) synthase TruB n=1 Tax=Anaeromyxobacter sp. (strain Fw109-5) TaxID=404589 RepID=UPI0000ED7F91|nr:tRNA pseudouridine(55) synthase TruB [Anaeromyxobacter sp. Fw109-5]ABS25352.1 tRNA pseudouridine synthase B [Anaeromyxobacter sp. Fw109-5]